MASRRSSQLSYIRGAASIDPGTRSRERCQARCGPMPGSLTARAVGIQRHIRHRILSISIAPRNAAPGSCRAMAFLGHVFEPQPAGPASGDLTEHRRRAVGARRLAHAVAAVRRAPELGGLIGISALLNLWALGRNGWANTYYSAAVRSMASSWHNFLYASLDPSGVMTVDKPPLSLWVQALSVRVFGFHPLAILVPAGADGGGGGGPRLRPRAAALRPPRRRGRRPRARDDADRRRDVARQQPRRAADAAAASRRSGSRCARSRTAARAGSCSAGSPSGWASRRRCCVALVVVPGDRAGLAVRRAARPRSPRCASCSPAARAMLVGRRRLAAARHARRRPADRPYISGTADNSILSLIFGYNGFGRVTGQAGGPAGCDGGAVGVVRPGHRPFPPPQRRAGRPGRLAARRRGRRGRGASLRREPRAPARPAHARGSSSSAARSSRSRLLFSFAQGIFHPYYVVLLAPFTAALVGAGVGTRRSQRGVRRGARRRRAARRRRGRRVRRARPTTRASCAGCEVVLPIVCGVAAVALFVAESRRAPRARRSRSASARAADRADDLGVRHARLRDADRTFPSGGPASASIARLGGGLRRRRRRPARVRRRVRRSAVARAARGRRVRRGGPGGGGRGGRASAVAAARRRRLFGGGGGFGGAGGAVRRRLARSAPTIAYVDVARRRHDRRLEPVAASRTRSSPATRTSPASAASPGRRATRRSPGSPTRWPPGASAGSGSGRRRLRRRRSASAAAAAARSRTADVPGPAPR